MSDTVTVDVAQGTLRGRKGIARTGTPYYSFQGVPFAKPPVGPLRFKVAEPPEPWEGVRDALKDGDMCTQMSMIDGTFTGSEDCLYLNVFTPQLPDGSDERPLLPVLFAVHGGGFIGGDGTIEAHGPDYVLSEGMVLVSPTYRVGVFGFLCVDGPACPGNMGLKDQVAALRWTQQNIAKFGGDPNNVTIYGVSAGGASVHYLMMSPMCEGLFHRAVSSSGAAINPWALTNEPKYMAFRLGSALGCSTDDPEELVDFLRNADHMEIVKAVNKDVYPESKKEALCVFPFTPTLEVEVEGVERFLPAHPLQLLNEGRFISVPSITGVAQEEALVLIQLLGLQNQEFLDKVDSNYEKTVLPSLRLPGNYSNTDKIISKLKSFFLKDKPLTLDTRPGFISLLSDVLFSEGADYTAKKFAEHSKAPAYQYCFTFEGKLSVKHSKMLNIKIDYPGATHGDDFLHLFVNKYIDSNVPPESAEAKTRSRLLKMLGDFARTGNPTPEMSSLVPLIWQPRTVDIPWCLNFGEELTMEEGFFPERMAFWEELYASAREELLSS